MVKQYEYMVKQNGKYYPAGTNVPADKSKKDKADAEQDKAEKDKADAEPKK